MRRGAPVCAVLTLAVAFAGCSSGNKHAATAGTTTVPKVLAISTSSLKVGKVDVESAGPPTAQIDTATGKAVLAATQAYIDRAVFAPLKDGALGAGYKDLFDPGVAAQATGPDQDALTDLAVGKATLVSAKADPVTMSALAGTLGELMYVATNFTLSVKVTSATQAVAITHHIELTFAKTGSAWLVTAYRVQSIHKTSAATTTTTAAAGSPTP